MLSFLFTGKLKDLGGALKKAEALQSKGLPPWQYWVCLTDFDWQGGSYEQRKDSHKELHSRPDNNRALGADHN